MASIEERVAYLEGRIEDHTAATAELRTTVREFRDETGRGLDDFSRQLDEFRAETGRRFDESSRRLDELRAETSRRFDEQRTETSQRFEQVNSKVDRHFTWLVGLQVTSLLAVMSAIAGLYLR